MEQAVHVHVKTSYEHFLVRSLNTEIIKCFGMGTPLGISLSALSLFTELFGYLIPK